ncbi:MAG: S41 family peptidase [Parvularculaceae bacterium]
MKRPAIALALAACAPADAPRAFDNAAAWAEFEAIVLDNYAYLDRGDARGQLARSKLAALGAPDEAAFRQVLHQTGLAFVDPHFVVGPLDADDFSIVMSGADMDVAFADGAYVVTDVKRDAAAALAGVRPGWRVVAVDGAPIDAAARAVFGDVLPSPDDAQLSYGATIAVSGRRGQPRRIEFETPDGPAARKLPATYDRLDEPRPPLDASRIGEVAIVRFNNSLGKDETIAAFDAAIVDAADAAAFVLDMRDTPGGGNTDVARAVIGHFVDHPQAYQVHEIPAVERETGVPRRFVEYALPRAPRFRGPVVVLHGRWTGSMGEGLVVGLHAAGARTIGSNMGDLLGGLWNFDMETAAIDISFGGEALFHVDGTPREDYVADEPLQRADMTADGADPATDAALAYLLELNR